MDLPDHWRLSWQDVDPAARPAFDPAGVAELVRGLPPAADVPPADADWRLVSFWFDRMTEALIDRLGDWVVGWPYTIAMEDYRGRGVVPVWRSAARLVTTPEETLARLAADVVAWHELLVEIATDARGRFSAGAPAGDGAPPAWRVVQGPDRIAVHIDRWDRTGPSPYRLTWAETDASLDPETVPAVVRAVLSAQEIPAQEADWRIKDLWLDSISAGLIDRYGSWAVGWRWSVGEGDLDGGPVGAWCCFRHSVTTPEATADAIHAALVEWRDWLDDLAERFDRFLPVENLDGWERAVAHLVTAVGDRTQYESAWYGCCETVLRWFLEAAGVDPARHEELLDHAIGGRFHSWVEPPREVVESVAEDVARRVAGG
ncbi:hypothetical protein [Asanoa siamensis]|uniref:hypothetical protein n=1 Tax=Asanoa siamensis TaxID=926357 RepID=UPI001944FE47|nr:hypothetical protein [Asanoa siamensis]